MAEELEQAGAVNPAEDKKKLKEERKRLKEEQKAQKKEAKARAKEIALKEAALEDEEEGSTVSAILVTLIIVIVWIGILCVLVKLNVGGFGSNVLAPLIKDVPVINKILPKEAATETNDTESYGGYTSLAEAVEQIKSLELQIVELSSSSGSYVELVADLTAEVERLKTFEKNQVEFERIKNQFYDEVIYAEKGPGPEEYIKYYESLDPTTAAELYKEVIQKKQETDEIKNYAQAYSEMKPKEAAAIFEAMTDNLDLAARILGTMEPDDRGKILGAMKADVAARITKIMDPES
jgi:flagellar motility protein MotE (MotC chaperone)